MKRKIIKIDEEKCTGCGQCIPGCPEGALRIIDNKARLISDLFCDGLGACIGECPEGAINIEEREAEPYDERKVMENIVKQGDNTIRAHLEHLREHNEKDLLEQAVDYLKENRYDVSAYLGDPIREKGSACGCPGSMTVDLRSKNSVKTSIKSLPAESQLRNWPVQLQLINPAAPYFRDAHLLIAADCVPFSYANFHQEFLHDKVLIIFCPKLDQTIDEYIDKLSDIFKNNNILSVSLVHMEVPCCFGVERIVSAAIQKAGKVIPVKDITISIKGEVML